jgi:hypothetical protein
MLFSITTAAGVDMLTTRCDRLPQLHADMDFPHSAMSPPHYKIAWSTVLILNWSVRRLKSAYPEIQPNVLPALPRKFRFRFHMLDAGAKVWNNEIRRSEIPP